MNGFIDGLEEYKVLIEAGEVPEVNMRDVRRYLVLEHMQRPEAMIEDHSTVAATLATWITNAVKYFDLLGLVEPKREVLRKFLQQHTAAQKRLEAARDALVQKKARLERLRRDVETVRKQWLDAVEQAKRGELRLELAEKLVVRKKKRWRRSSSSPAP